MAKTYNQLVDDFKSINNDSSSGTIGKTFLNIGIRKILGLSDWTFLRGTKQYSTGTSVQTYRIPYDADRADYLKYWYGGAWYYPEQVHGDKRWTEINAVDTVTASIPYYWYFDSPSKQIYLYPKSTDVNGTIIVEYTKKIRDFSVSDYSTGSVSCSSSGTFFTGVGTSWGTPMEGRYIKVSSGISSMDGFWFEIDSVGSTTNLVVKELIPEAVSEGTYVISELMPFPEGFEDLPLWYSLEKYYRFRQDTSLAREYKTMYEEGISDLKRRDSKTVKHLIEQQSPVCPENPSYDPWRMGPLS